jgi:hypothetical protein
MAGTSRANITAMMAITTSSSTSVNPDWRRQETVAMKTSKAARQAGFAGRGGG